MNSWKCKHGKLLYVSGNVIINGSDIGSMLKLTRCISGMGNVTLLQEGTDVKETVSFCISSFCVQVLVNNIFTRCRHQTLTTAGCFCVHCYTCRVSAPYQCCAMSSVLFRYTGSRWDAPVWLFGHSLRSGSVSLFTVSSCYRVTLWRFVPGKMTESLSQDCHQENVRFVLDDMLWLQQHIWYLATSCY